MRQEAAVIITDSQGRQVFGLTGTMSARLVKEGTPATFQGFTVRVLADPIPGWWVDLPGYVALAYCRNRVRTLREYIRQRRLRRAIALLNASRAGAGTTSQSNSTIEVD
jgi:hypothetical protein